VFKYLYKINLKLKKPMPENKTLNAMMMEAVSTSETPVNFFQTTRRNIPEVSHLRNVIPRCFTEQHVMQTVAEWRCGSTHS
jgi:hypothetical protein